MFTFLPEIKYKQKMICAHVGAFSGKAKACTIFKESKVPYRSLSLYYCVILIPKLAKRSSKYLNTCLGHITHPNSL